MKNKEEFGLLIAEKRKEKKLTQAELAEKLYVTKTAVSKWERGVTYPDITLIADLCAILDVDEHELIGEGHAGEYGKLCADAKRYRRIADIYFYGLCIAYGLALLVCFICNLAVNKTLSWFFIVLTSLLTAFTLFPSPARFVKKYKLLTVVVSFAISMSLLLVTCCIYGGGTWFFIADFSVILGLVCVFLPVFIRIYPVPHTVKRHAPIICVCSDMVLLLLLLIVSLYSSALDLDKGIAVSVYFFLPVLICVLVFSYTKINVFFKSAVSCVIGSVAVFFADAVSGELYDTQYSLAIDLLDWKIDNINANVRFIILLLALLAAIILTSIGIYKAVKSRKEVVS